MFNLRQAQIISRNIENQYRNMFDKTVKWTEIYNSESAIVDDLKNIHVPENKDITKVMYLYSGYEYIHNFAKLIQNNKALTEKQMIQCKRLALEIKKAWSIKNCW